MDSTLDRLPKTKQALVELERKTDPKHIDRLDKAIEQAIMKAWVEVHGTGMRKQRR